ncbi:superoxide dismutase family protein [Psychrobacter sp. I-STPA10]|uniref:superoxide dismutase family protein n=1 Tax=Psychrobacter sp. I-STPA10 TaxID=2585769 RepID=UPI001E2BFCD2|nr:superoxide dismutase family protein [Psychrobacter sp. I-STPA10]
MKIAKLTSLLFASTLVAATTLSGCQSLQGQMKTGNPFNQPQLKSTIQSVDGNHSNIGEMYLRQVDNGVQVYGQINGLQPNATYALHIHETGSCNNAGKTAGGHFNPNNTAHGNPDDINSHAGDLPNITADANGVATMNYVKQGISVDMGADNSVYRRAFILHAGADDYQTQPSGDSGERIACGVIEKN